MALSLTACANSTSNNTRAESGTQPTTDYIWVGVGANNQQVARVATTAKTCPHIVLDNHSKQMSQRGKDNRPTGFNQVISCETFISAHVKSAAIKGTKLALLKAKPQKIVVIGDTGCRVKNSDYQNCNGVEGYGPAWPFAKVASEVAKTEPDLVIHLGDYHYRELPCPPGNKGCSGPWGYNWPSWQADFFEPAQALLSKTPWIFTRGNHEDCKRAYKGWFYFLDPAVLPTKPWKNCREYTPSYTIDLGDLNLVQMDSATLPNAYNGKLNSKTVNQYKQMFDEVNQLAAKSKNSWFVNHRPVWAISSYFDWKNNSNALAVSDPTMQAALKASGKGRFADSINLLLAGHIHNFEALSYNDGRPPSLVVGDSGTRLAPNISEQQKAQQNKLLASIGVIATDFFADAQFAFAVFERHPHDAWLIKMVDVDGKTQQSFTLQGKRLARIWE